MIFNQKNLIISFIGLLIFLISFQNYNGNGSLYIFVNEYLSNDGIFTLDEWTYYAENSFRYFPLRLLNLLGLEINNDFHLFSIYFCGGIISIYCLNRIILEFFEVKDFYSRFTIIFCTAFANFIIFKSVWSSSFLPFNNFQTATTTQLIYPLFYLVLSKRFFFAGIISSIMIFLHFSVAWLPTLIFSFFLISKTKFRQLNILNLFIPFFTFLLIYYFNINDLIDSNVDNIKTIEKILDRSGEEAVISLQPIQRIIYFFISIFIFFILNRKIVRNNDLNLFFSITLYLSIFVSLFGFLWTTIGYKYLPFVSLSYLYFLRSILSYHIVFLLLIAYFIYFTNFSQIKKITFFIIIYTLGTTYFSLKGIVICLFLFLFSIIFEKLIKKKQYEKFINSKSTLMILLVYVLITQLYLIKKNTLNHIDKWSIEYLNDWTDYSITFSKKNYDFKNDILSLRNCEDFILIPIISSNGFYRYEPYINIVSHKSNFVVDSSLFFSDVKKNEYNLKKDKVLKYFIKNLNEGKEIERLLNSDNFMDSVFLFENEIYQKYFFDQKSLEKNFFRLSDKLTLFSRNREINEKIEKCNLKKY